MRLTHRELTRGIATALYAAVLITAPVALAQKGTARLDRHAVFEWAPPERAAELRYSEPPGLVLGDVVDATLSRDGVLASFGSSSNARELLFSIESPFAASNLIVRYLLADGGEFQVELGAVEVVEVELLDEGALVEERAIAAPAAGLYLAAALRNVSDSPLRLEGVRYLPEPYRPGQLLLAVTDDPDGAVANVAATFTPSNLDAWDRGVEERPEPLVEGFEWVRPGDLGRELAPGRSVVLVWTDDAFAADEAPNSFSLRPTLEYALPGGSQAQLGLALPARREPTEDAAR